MGNNSVKNSRIQILKPHAHVHIIGRKSTIFQVNSMKDGGGVAETRSLRWTDGRTEGRADDITQTRTDEGHFYSPPPPASGDNYSGSIKVHAEALVYEMSHKSELQLLVFVSGRVPMIYLKVFTLSAYRIHPIKSTSSYKCRASTFNKKIHTCMLCCCFTSTVNI